VQLYRVIGSDENATNPAGPLIVRVINRLEVGTFLISLARDQDQRMRFRVGYGEKSCFFHAFAAPYRENRANRISNGRGIKKLPKCCKYRLLGRLIWWWISPNKYHPNE
jgi:hypothetical protein